MSAPHIILDNLPSLCQKLSVWRSYNKNNFVCFFETRCRSCRVAARHGGRSKRPDWKASALALVATCLFFLFSYCPPAPVNKQPSYWFLRLVVFVVEYYHW